MSDPRADLAKAAEEVRAKDALDPVAALRFTEPLEQRTRRAVVRLELDGDLQLSADLHSLFGDLLEVVATKLHPEDGALFLEMGETWKLAAEGIARAAQHAGGTTPAEAAPWPEAPAPPPTLITRATEAAGPRWGKTSGANTNPSRASGTPSARSSATSPRYPGPRQTKR